MHGFGIARRVEEISRGCSKVNPGSLLTALQRLERAGWLDAEWSDTETRAARSSTRSLAREETTRGSGCGLEAAFVRHRAAVESRG
jgi:hypothetical protein